MVELRQWSFAVALGALLAGCSAITDFGRFRAVDAEADATTDAAAADGSPRDTSPVDGSLADAGIDASADAQID